MNKVIKQKDVYIKDEGEFLTVCLSDKAMVAAEKNKSLVDIIEDCKFNIACTSAKAMTVWAISHGLTCECEVPIMA